MPIIPGIIASSSKLQGYFKSIATIAASGDTSLTFSSIPQTYRMLQLRVLSKVAAFNTAGASISITFNSDTGTNYAYMYLNGDGTNTSGNGTVSVSQTSIQVLDAAVGASSLGQGCAVIEIIDYSSTVKYKAVKYNSGSESNLNQTTNQVVIGAGTWNSTNAITSISISNAASFPTGSTFALYGLI